jgi:hypothetical protein
MGIDYEYKRALYGNNMRANLHAYERTLPL